MIHRLTN